MQRQKAKHNFEKGFFKLMINPVFGKREEITHYRNQIIILQSFPRKIY